MNDLKGTPLSADSGEPAGQLRAWLQLLRIANLPTALADVAMGFLFVQLVVTPGDALLLATLMLCSALLYSAGMVLNDVFDLPVDAEERPFRPLPSGRVSLATARAVGWGLLLSGIVAGGLASLQNRTIAPAGIALILAACVVAYDVWLKRTAVGPVAMGTCRALNVLLGMSAVSAAWQFEHGLVAAAIGVYIAGVTQLARNEAGRSDRFSMGLGITAMVFGVVLLAWFPQWTDRLTPLLQRQPWRWALVLSFFGAIIAWRSLYALADPTPARVQIAVKQAILSLIVLDAAVVLAVRGPEPALAVLVLLLPATWFGRWIYST